MKPLLLYFFTAILFLTTVNGQQYYFNHFQVEKGLSNNTAFAILQDKRGFIWIGTKDGLNRFDGNSFKIYRHIPGDSTSLGNHSIRKIFEDASGILWLGTENGVYSFDPDTEQFSMPKNVPGGEVRGIVADGEGNIWMLIQFKLYKWEKGSQSVGNYDSILNGNHCTALSATVNGEIWVSVISGMIGRYQPTQNAFQWYSVFSHSPPPVSRSIERIYDSGEGYLFVGTSNQGIKKFDLRANTYTDLLIYSEDHTAIYARDFIKVNAQEYWFATETGIYIYNIQTQSFKNLKKNYRDPYALSDNAVYSFCKDREGGIWVGTYFGGLNYYPRQDMVFEKYFPGKDGKAISGNAIREIVQDNKGQIWIGSEDAGLNKFDPHSSSFDHFKPTGNTSGLAHTNIHGLMVDDQQLWIGTFEHGLDIMDLNTQKVVKHFNAGAGPYDLKSNFIHSMYKTREGIIWLATSNGLYTYDRSQQHFIRAPGIPDGIFFSCIIEDNQGTIWAGTFQNGMYYFNPKKGVHGRLQILQNKTDRLKENRITFLKQTQDGSLWIGTEQGLYAINLETRISKMYSTKSGLPSNLTYALVEDQQNRRWITTSKGLVVLDFDGKPLHTFSNSAGLLGDQFNYAAAFQDQQGIIYFGSLKGLIRFNPNQLRNDDFIPPLYITRFQLANPQANENRLQRSSLDMDKITLNHLQSTFTIDFAALSFRAPDNIQYAYKMEGIDPQWNYIKTNRSVYFTNLAPGRYNFKVRSTNTSGIWQKNEKSIIITIHPPIWNTSWAYLLYSMLAMAMGYFLLKEFRRRQIQKMQLFKMQQERELFDSKINFFTKVAHEIRTPLTLIKAPLEKLMSQMTPTPTIQKYLQIMSRNTERLLQLTSTLLDFRKVESEHFSLNLQKTSMRAWVQSIYMGFHPTAEKKGLKFTLQIPTEEFQAEIDSEAYTKVLSNLLDNAIKYGKSTVTLTLLPPEQEQFILQVSNDGKIIPSESSDKIFEPFQRLQEMEKISGTGIGLSLARSLVELHGGRLVLVANEGLIIFEATTPIHYQQ